jgi:DNA modification methylase
MSEPRAVYDASPVIVTGDALELIPTLDDGSVQLVVTSPPYPGQYGNTMSVGAWLRWAEQWLTALGEKLTPTGVVALNVMFKKKDSGFFDNRILDLTYVSMHGPEST